MGFIRVALFAAVIWIVYSLYRKQMQKRISTSRKTKEKVQPCEHCGVFVPEQDVVIVNDKVYCSHEHAQEHTRAD